MLYRQQRVTQPSWSSDDIRPSTKRVMLLSVIDMSDIQAILDRCPKETIEVDDKFVVHDSRVVELVTEWTDKLFNMIPELFAATMANKEEFERNHATDEPFAIAFPVFFELASAIHNFATRWSDLDSDVGMCCGLLFRNVLVHFQGFVALMLTGVPSAAAAQIRTIYESYVLLRFIAQNPATARAFLDHEVIKQTKIFRAFGDHEIGKSLQIEFDALIVRYGESFRQEYGWATSVFPESTKVTFRMITEATDLEGYRPAYVLASELLHASSYGVSFQNLEHEYSTFFWATAIELMSNTAIWFAKNVSFTTNEHLVLMNIIYGLREDVFGEPQGTQRETNPEN